MPTFKLTWTIDAEGTDALDAARRVATDYFQARIAQGHPDTACVFQLTDHEGQAVTIDLSAHRIHLECAHAAECERLCAMLDDWESDANLLEKERDEARAELSALKAHPEAYQFDGQVLRDEHGNYLAEFMAYEQSFIDRLLHPQPELKAQQVGQEPQRCQCCGYLVTESEHRGCLRAAAPQPAPSQDVAGVLEPGKIVVSAEPLRRVLNALVNAPHRIRELQVTREPVELFANNPINILIAEFEAAHEKQSGEVEP